MKPLYQCLNNFQLKLIALIFMAIDHIGAVCFPDILLLQILGRIAFPIFCFLLVEGFTHTKNLKRYLMRIGIVALLSDIPFDLAIYGKCTLYHQNTFFTLFFGLLMMTYLSRLVVLESPRYQRLASVLVVFFFATVAMYMHTDYSSSGVGLLLIFIFYEYRIRNLSEKNLIILFALWCLICGNIEIYAFFAIIPICMYNGEKGSYSKWLFYGFYPAHLLILALIRYYML
ncbi:MAG: TraX family protein [Lachnospiraceae bacterium]